MFMMLYSDLLGPLHRQQLLREAEPLPPGAVGPWMAV